jgi:hypothetical protein
MSEREDFRQITGATHEPDRVARLRSAAAVRRRPRGGNAETAARPHIAERDDAAGVYSSVWMSADDCSGH